MSTTIEIINKNCSHYHQIHVRTIRIIFSSKTSFFSGTTIRIQIRINLIPFNQIRNKNVIHGLLSVPDCSRFAAIIDWFGC